MLTQEYLKTCFDYDATNGVLIWKWRDNIPNNINAKMAGTVAGSYAGRHLNVGLDGARYLVHRLIFLYVYGYMPEKIDHKNRDGLLNCHDNLREVTHAQNMANRTCKGIEKHGRKFRACIMVNYEKIRLGSFDTENEARNAYIEASRRYHSEFSGYA